MCEKKKNEIIRYKAILVDQGFSQRPVIDYDKTYYPVMNETTFWYLINLTFTKNLEKCLIDVVTAYLYKSLDNDIFMKILKEFKMLEASRSKPRKVYLIKLRWSLYGLK